MPVWVHPPGFIPISTRQPHLNVLEHVGMVADLAQLHDCVHQSLCATFPLPGTIQEVKNPDYCWVPSLFASPAFPGMFGNIGSSQP